MQILKHFLIGLSTSILGSCPLSALNLNAADMAMRRPFRDVIWYALGVSSLESIQIFVAIRGGQWLSTHLLVDAILQVSAVPVFFTMAIFFWFHGMKKQRKERHIPSRLHPFFIGVFLAMFNCLAIPFWLYYTSLFYRLGWVEYTLGNEVAFVIGCWIATFCVLLIFGRFSRYMARKFAVIDNWSRHIIAVVFFVLGLVQVANIVYSGTIIQTITDAMSRV